MSGRAEPVRVLGLNGDGWAAPAGTVEALWAALGAGADGLALNVFRTADGHLVCTPEANLLGSCDVDVDVADIALEKLQRLDAGITYRSSVLDGASQPTGERGADTPWRALEQEHPLKVRTGLHHPRLEHVLQLFGRRATSLLQVPPPDHPCWERIIEATAALVADYGLRDTAMIGGTAEQLRHLRSAMPRGGRLALDLGAEPLDAHGFETLAALDGAALLVRAGQLLELPPAERDALLRLADERRIAWLLRLDGMPFAPTPALAAELLRLGTRRKWLIAPGAKPSVDALRPPSTVFRETFAGDRLDPRYWRAGYSHVNDETRLFVDDELIIDIVEGWRYSGGAAMLTLPLHGPFDAIVSFRVEHPHQATTFELAAIGIDPGYDHQCNTDLDTRSANLTFDVHGAPPYASSERDQNDGFRCGWNNSSNLTRIGPDFEAASVNMYNKYGRDVGDGGECNPEGELRLTRHGAVFNAYYRDRHNRAWVCSGSMLVPALPEDVWIRLAAKHWHKIHPAPRNTVRFRRLTVAQPEMYR